MPIPFVLVQAKFRENISRRITSSNKSNSTPK